MVVKRSIAIAFKTRQNDGTDVHDEAKITTKQPSDDTNEFTSGEAFAESEACHGVS